MRGCRKNGSAIVGWKNGNIPEHNEAEDMEMRNGKTVRKMKNNLAALCACAVAFLCFAAHGAAEAQPETPSVQEAIAAYAEVLLGRQPYVQTGDGAGETAFSAQPAVWYGYELGGAYTVSRFCVTDLDADGLPEIILDLPDREGYTFGYELLRYEAGTVYGFAFTLRSMQDITLGGDIETSGGAGDNGWYTLRFAADQAEYVETCRMQSTNGYEQYFIGDAEVTQEQYLAFTDRIEAEARPVWLAFTEENIQYVAAQFQVK